MLRSLKTYTKFLLAVASIAILTACGTPVTKPTPMTEAELKQERQAQKEMAQKYPPKTVVRKHKELAVYRARLDRVSAPLAHAAKQLCSTSECTYNFKVINQEGLNAYTDGKNVIFTPEMMDFLESDKELATVVAHELSHNVMGHHAKQKQNVIMGSILDMVIATRGLNTGGIFGNIGSMSYSQGFENEADYVGIYIMALAGYDISNVHHIWRKMTIQTGTGTNASFFSSHPSNPERFIRMKRAVEEVQAKQKSGGKLMPNYKT